MITLIKNRLNNTQRKIKKPQKKHLKWRWIKYKEFHKDHYQ
jgi:hypothetical protein